MIVQYIFLYSQNNSVKQKGSGVEPAGQLAPFYGVCALCTPDMQFRLTGPQSIGP